jgi:hypothetical protein
MSCRTEKVELMTDLVGKLSDDEIKQAIKSTVGEINSKVPVTNYTLDEMMNLGSAWEYLVLLGSSKNSIRTLIFNWTSEGVSIQDEIASVDSKLGDYNSLYSTMYEEFSSAFSNNFKQSALRGSCSAHITTGKVPTTGMPINRLPSISTVLK